MCHANIPLGSHDIAVKGEREEEWTINPTHKKGGGGGGRRVDKSLKALQCGSPRTWSGYHEFSGYKLYTGVVGETPHRKGRETKHQPNRASCSQQLGCRSISLYFL